MGKKIKIALQYIIGFPLLWLLFAFGGFIAANPILLFTITMLLGASALIYRKWDENKRKKLRREGS
ncbi:hypothetical protein ASD24_26780 [Paenibacillus sp. Root52]|nr:hypothetical protein ASD24_26780 [Paenibacillus sp. Root52]